MAGNCKLDESHFEMAVGDYEGTFSEPLTLLIHQDNMTCNVDENFHFDDDLHAQLEDNPNTLGLIRVDLVVSHGNHNSSDDEQSSANEVLISHRNLLILDALEKKIYRFEPTYEINGSDTYDTRSSDNENDVFDEAQVEISQTLIDYFYDILPDYEFIELDYHPELKLKQSGDNTCTGPGYCMAFVIKTAMLVSQNRSIIDETTNVPDFIEEIVKQYELEQNQEQAEEQNEEYGFFSKNSKSEVTRKAQATQAVPPPRAYGGNPMKAPAYNTKAKSNASVDSSKVFGGAAAAADINRRPLNKR